LRLLHELHRNGPGAPVIFLSDHVDEATVDAALKAGTWDFVPTPSLDEASIKRTIRYAIDAYCKDRQRQKSEDTLRKLWRAVEQSGDLVIITDRTGMIEYVNPAFEALTGYSREEVMGGRRKSLNPAIRLLNFTKNCGKPFFQEMFFATSWSTARRMATSS
jgi:PAS domain-containing protein